MPWTFKMYSHLGINLKNTMKTAVVLTLAAVMLAAASATFFDGDDDFYFDDRDDGDDFYGFSHGGMAFGPTIIGHGNQMIGDHQSTGHFGGGYGHIGNFIHKPIISHALGPLCNKFGGYGKVLAHKPMYAHKTLYPSMKGVSSYIGGSSAYHTGGVVSYDKGLYGGYTGGALSGNTGYPATYSMGAAGASYAGNGAMSYKGAGSMSYTGAGTAGYAGVSQYAGASGYQPVAQNYY